MSSLVFVDFRPAELKCTAKETYVAFYAKNPSTGLLERQRIRLNYIKGKTERKKYGTLMVQEINRKLYAGWNPFVEKCGLSKVVTTVEAVGLYRNSYRKGLRPDSLRCYESMSESFVRHLSETGQEKKPIFLFSKQDCQRYMMTVDEKGVAGKTYNNYLRFMGQFFNFLIEKGLVKENHFSAMKTKRVDKKQRKTITVEVRRQIMEYFDKMKMPEFKMICTLTFRCLIRPKEILQLRVRDIDLKRGVIEIPPDVAKNHCARTVAMPPDVKEYMQNTVEGLPPALFVFSKKYRPGKTVLTTRDTERTWAVMRTELGLPACYQFYSLKDTGITEMLENGVPAKLVQELADHHSLEMTQKYVQRSRAEEILKYNSVLEI